MGKIFSFLAANLLLLLLAACNLPTGSTTVSSQTIPPTAISTSTATHPGAVLATATLSPSQTAEAVQSETTLPSPYAWTPAVAMARRYAVILVAKNDVLNIRAGAGSDYGIVGQFTPDETNVLSTGQVAVVDGQTWLQVENPSGGTGWVNAWYLTEYVSKQEFCSDQRVNTLLDNLSQAVNKKDGELLKTLVSPAHGLSLYYWRGGRVANYTPEEASWVFQSTYQVNWGSGPSGMDDIGTFSDYPLPALQEVLNDEKLELQCNDASSASMYVEPWPQIYSNVRYYALYKPGTPDVDLDWEIWLAGVEYVEKEPYLFALIRFVWEP